MTSSLASERKDTESVGEKGQSGPEFEDHEAAPLTEEPLNTELGVETDDVFEHDD